MRYRGDYQQKSFSCWDQYLAMGFARFTYRKSLRDIEACLRSVGGKLYHMGFRSRDWRIFADFAQVLIAVARPLYADDPIGVDRRAHRTRPQGEPRGCGSVPESPRRSRPLAAF